MPRLICFRRKTQADQPLANGFRRVTRCLLTICWMVLVLACFRSAEATVRRRITIRSNPPGALVYIDDQEIGITPVSTSFVYYGTRKIQLLKDGFETLTVKQRFRAPWYQFTPIDFFSENLWPSEIRDERVLDFQLIPMRNVPNQELRARGEDLRLRSRRGVVTPIPGFYGSVNPGSQIAPESIAPGTASPSGILPAPSPGTGGVMPAPSNTLPPSNQTLPPAGMPLPPDQTSPFQTLPRGGVVVPDPPPPLGTPIAPRRVPIQSPANYQPPVVLPPVSAPRPIGY